MLSTTGVLWAVVPVKPFYRGKSRLAGVLSTEDRVALNRCFLESIVQALTAVPAIEHVLVVSRDPQVLALARSRGARTLLEHGSQDLNLALGMAAAVVKKFTGNAILVIPADLPLVGAEDIRILVDNSPAAPFVRIAPDRHRRGTNALLFSPIGSFPFSYGPDSFQRHCDLALRVGMKVEVVDMPALALDIDLPEDLALLRSEVNALGINASAPYELNPCFLGKNFELQRCKGREVFY